jgi:hypothetical protein
MCTMTIILTAFAIAGVFVLFAVLVGASTARHQANFEMKFSPITDDEFMARLPAGTNRDIALKVRRIVATQLAVEYDRLSPECRFVEDLGAD